MRPLAHVHKCSGLNSNLLSSIWKRIKLKQIGSDLALNKGMSTCLFSMFNHFQVTLPYELSPRWCLLYKLLHIIISCWSLYRFLTAISSTTDMGLFLLLCVSHSPSNLCPETDVLPDGTDSPGSCVQMWQWQQHFWYLHIDRSRHLAQSHTGRGDTWQISSAPGVMNRVSIYKDHIFFWSVWTWLGHLCLSSGAKEIASHGGQCSSGRKDLNSMQLFALYSSWRSLLFLWECNEVANNKLKGN